MEQIYSGRFGWCSSQRQLDDCQALEEAEKRYGVEFGSNIDTTESPYCKNFEYCFPGGRCEIAVTTGGGYQVWCHYHDRKIALKDPEKPTANWFTDPDLFITTMLNRIAVRQKNEAKNKKRREAYEEKKKQQFYGGIPFAHYNDKEE